MRTFKLLICLAAYAGSAAATPTARIVNDTPVCVCIQATATGGGSDGDKNCAETGKTTSSHTSTSIRTVNMYAYNIAKCSERSKASLISKADPTFKGVGRSKTAYFGAFGSYPGDYCDQTVSAVNFDGLTKFQYDGTKMESANSWASLKRPSSRGISMSASGHPRGCP